jgi:hypothetical protein
MLRIIIEKVMRVTEAENGMEVDAEGQQQTRGSLQPHPSTGPVFLA